MAERLSRWGVGPRIFVAGGTYAVAAGMATHLWPGVCVVQPLHHPVFVAVAAAFLVMGVPMWLIAIATVMRAYRRDRLATSGVFALVRHPVYSAVIVLILPGLTLLTCSWPLLLTPLVAYVVFKRVIHREDEYLQERFGPSYLEYRSRVNEIIPLPRLRHA